MSQAFRLHFKLILLASLLLFQVVSAAQGTWERMPVPTTRSLKSVCFVDSLYGWVSGDSGTILHTTDGGASWTFQASRGFNEIADVFFLNRDLGWASSLNYTTTPYGTVLLKTTNGGADWTEFPYPAEDIFIYCILFRDSLNGWIGGSPHALAKTTNGGIDWREAEVDTSILAFFPVLSIQFFNDMYGYASGGMFDIAGVIWRTSNGGEKWYAIDASEAPADEVHGLHIFDSIHVMGAGGDPDFGYGVGMIRTSDGGLHWSYDELGIQGNAYDLDFRNDTEVWAPLGPKRMFIYSLDAGTTWKGISTPELSSIYDVTFPDTLHGFAVGRDGAMLKYRPRIVPSVDPITPVNDEFVLFQNFPNPFNTTTKIRYRVPAHGKIDKTVDRQPFTILELTVSDPLGNEVAVRTVNDRSPGEHSLEFNAEGLPCGFYFYQLRLVSGGQSISLTQPGKFILLR